MREQRWEEVSMDAGVAKKAGVKRTMRNQRLVRGLSKCRALQRDIAY